jgi:tetratricopeptide (TPR) repeat protein
MDDIFAIQDEISSEVIGQLNFGDASPAAPISRKVDFEAYKLYLRANHLNTFGVDDGSSEDAARLALELLEQAVAIDPAFIDAWLELSLASYRLWRHEGKPPESPMLARSDEAIEHARRLDAEHPVLLAYQAGGAFLEGQGDTQTIASQLEKAIEAAPTNPDVIRASRQFAASIGRVDSAVAMAELAVDRDPRCALCWYVLSQALRDAGRNAEAEDAGKMALSLGMNLEFSIATTQLYQHNPDGMLARFTNDRPDNAQGLWAYAMALHTAGRSEEFESVFAELRDNFADDAPLEIGMVYAWSGNTDAAFAWLGRAAESKPADLQTRYRSPFLFNLHGDPRWDDLLRRIERHPEQLAKIEFDPDIPEVQR